LNNPDHISESLGKFFWVKILKFFLRIRDGKIGSGILDPGNGIWDKHPGSATLVKKLELIIYH
jgi:hypothetical protein